MGVTGVVLDRSLVQMGAEAGAAFVLVLVVRASTFWLALALGQLALLRTTLASRPADHFEALSAEYDAQIPVHVRQLLVERKTRKMLDRLGDVRGRRGLDIGCGLGWYLTRLHEEGARVVGLDLSAAQIRQAHTGGAPVVRASALVLPFASDAFDFVYSVNVIHHLPSREHQQRALAEAARVLRPGGILFVHEINVGNPLFRFYMSYVFPLLKRIDEGIELWIDPERTPIPSSLRRDSLEYFTFVPDFLPRALLRAALPLEARLERSRLARYSAHFVLVLQKSEAEAGPTPR
jgi:SAM-dependent methyltransferase